MSTTPHQPEPSAVLFLDHCEPHGHAYAKIVGVDSGCPHCLAIGRDVLRAEIQAAARENAELLRDKARLDWLEREHFLVDFINEDVEPTPKGEFICTNGENSQCAPTIRQAIDAARTAPLPAPAGCPYCKGTGKISVVTMASIGLHGTRCWRCKGEGALPAPAGEKP